MKTIRKISTKDFADNRFEMSNHQLMVPNSKLSAGSVADKYPVAFDNGKTIIFISDKSKEPEKVANDPKGDAHTRETADSDTHKNS